MDQLVVVLDRGPEVDHRRSWVVLDVDELAGVLGERAGLGDHQHDRITHEAHDTVGKGTGAERPCVQRVPVGSGGKILEGVHRENARKVGGFCAVDA